MSLISPRLPRTYDPYSFDDWIPYYNYHHGGGSIVTHQSAFSSNGATTPFVNGMVEWKETAEGHEIKAHLPGFKKEEVKIELEEGNVLCISCEKNIEKEEKAENFYRVERSSGKFVKRFQLPEKAKADMMRAHMENGVLTISIPRKEKKLISNSRPIHIF